MYDCIFGRQPCSKELVSQEVCSVTLNREFSTYFNNTKIINFKEKQACFVFNVNKQQKEQVAKWLGFGEQATSSDLQDLVIYNLAGLSFAMQNIEKTVAGKQLFARRSIYNSDKREF